MIPAVLGAPYFLYAKCVIKSHPPIRLAYCLHYSAPSSILLTLFVVKCDYFIRFAWSTAWFQLTSTQISCACGSLSPQPNFAVYYVTLLAFGDSGHTLAPAIELRSSMHQRSAHFMHLNANWLVDCCSRTVPWNYILLWNDFLSFCFWLK